MSLLDRAGDRGTVEPPGEPVSEADCGQFEVIADVHEPDENAQDRSRSHLCGIGWIPGLRAVAAGAGAYLLCVPWRERTITVPRSTFVGRPAGTLYLGRVGHVSGLSDDDLRAMSDIIAKLPPPKPVSDTPDPARMNRGRALAQQNRCNFCHQSNFQGLDNVPRLGSQREDYLLKSLRAYKDNSRRGYDAQMSEVVYAMKDEDFVDLAYFLARVK